MRLEDARLRERLAAVLALVRTVSGVNAHVVLERGQVRETAAAESTLELLPLQNNAAQFITTLPW